MSYYSLLVHHVKDCHVITSVVQHLSYQLENSTHKPVIGWVCFVVNSSAVSKLPDKMNKQLLLRNIASFMKTNSTKFLHTTVNKLSERWFLLMLICI